MVLTVDYDAVVRDRLAERLQEALTTIFTTWGFYTFPEGRGAAIALLLAAVEEVLGLELEGEPDEEGEEDEPECS